jgi:thiamine pyrophosphokinase
VAEDLVRTVVVLAGGPDLPQDPVLPPHIAVIAADGGAEHAPHLGLRVDRVVGDLDSLRPATAEVLAAAGVAIEHHPVDKDKTDFELSLEAALVLQPDRIVVVGSATGRLDHVLGQLTVLTSGLLADVEVDAFLGPARLHVVRTRRVLHGKPGELVSLFALPGPASGVTSTGLEYRLDAETLPAGVGRGVSNVFAAERAEVSLTDGVILVVRPGFVMTRLS